MPRIGRFYFEELAHTADKAIIAHGETFEAMLESAAAGMFAQQVDLASVPLTSCWRISAEAESAEDLLVAWLRELLVLSEREDAVFAEFSVKQCAPWKVQGEVRGGKFTDKIVRTGAAVKAITYHNLSVRQAPDWQGTVTFDV
jgi:SHS2 domain-containing protein